MSTLRSEACPALLDASSTCCSARSLTAFALVEMIRFGGATWFALAFIVLPDVALIYGADRNWAPGQLHPRAVRFYNTVHSFWIPLVLMLAGLWLPPLVFTAGAVWAATSRGTAGSASACARAGGSSSSPSARGPDVRRGARRAGSRPPGRRPAAGSRRSMSENPANLALRFLLELAALAALGYWGWVAHDGASRWVWTAGLVVGAAAVWGVFRCPATAARRWSPCPAGCGCSSRPPSSAEPRRPSSPPARRRWASSSAPSSSCTTRSRTTGSCGSSAPATGATAPSLPIRRVRLAVRRVSGGRKLAGALCRVYALRRGMCPHRPHTSGPSSASRSCEAAPVDGFSSEGPGKSRVSDTVPQRSRPSNKEAIQP